MVRYVGRPLAALLAWDVAMVAYQKFHWEAVGFPPHSPGPDGVIVGFRRWDQRWSASYFWLLIRSDAISRIHSKTRYDLPLSSITHTIEINLRQLLGEHDLPSPIKLVGGVLW